MKKRVWGIAGAALILAIAAMAVQAVELPSVFGSHMVMQRDLKAPVWGWANAVIDGQTVVVSSPEVPKPVAVRYAYRTNPEGCNLYNNEGLPASPFRTDEW